MIKKSHWSKLILGAIIFVLIFTSLCYGNTDNESDTEDYTPSLSKQQLSTLYLGTAHLLPDPPGPDKMNKTELSAQNQSVFGRNILDRKFNSKMKPGLNLWFDAHGKKGIQLEFEISLQAVEDSTVLPDKTYKIRFKNFTTQGAAGVQNLNITYLDYQGKPFDIKYGAENWCSVTLIIKRMDNITDTKLTIYCGADNKISNITLPYDRTLSAHDYEKEKEDSENATPGFNSVEIIISVTILMIFFQIKNASQIKC